MRQVSFTLLIAGHCDSNPAQYERNRRFGHLVHVLGRSAAGAKLPSVGVCLNASKAESRLGKTMLLLGREVCSGVVRMRVRPPVQHLSMTIASIACVVSDTN